MQRAAAGETKNECWNRDRGKGEGGQSRSQAQGEIGTIGITRLRVSDRDTRFKLAATNAGLRREGRGREGEGGKRGGGGRDEQRAGATKDAAARTQYGT
jgi:hypothetical protein